MSDRPGHTHAVPASVETLEDILSQPPDYLCEAWRGLQGDLILLGVGGKMGPTMARMAKRALQQLGSPHKVVGVSRFQDATLRQRLEKWGIETIACDLLDEQQVRQLPDAPHVIAMSGFKFGTHKHPEQAWAANCYMPALICRRYRRSRIIAFSTGNVYGMVPRATGGSVETDPPRPDGEYSMTALGRERMYQFFCQRHETPVALLRLNYATELRYGVLVDLAQQIADDQPVDVTMGYVNVIWLGDANAMALAALGHAGVPAHIINLAGPEIVSVRDIALQLAAMMNKAPLFVGQERDDSLLNNGRRGHQLLGQPSMPISRMLEWTADWISHGRPTLGKPTHFQTRSGAY